MSEPPWGQGRSSDQSWPQNHGGTPDQGGPPDQGRSSSQAGPSDQGKPPPWPSGDQPSAWPSGDPPPEWPSGDPPPRWPSADQPPAWPSAGSARGQHPFWPAPDQAPLSGPPGGTPYPGPRDTYGYSPRAPRFARRPRFVGPIIVLGLFIVLGFVVRHVTSHHTVSVTTFPSASGGRPAGQAPAGAIGSAFSITDGQGNVYRVTLVRVIDPARRADQLSSPDSGHRFVGLVFRIKALTGSPQDEDANNDAVVVGGNGQTYPAGFQAIAGYTNFDHGAIHVAQGETATGSVSFQVPNGVEVSTVRWTALSGFGSTFQWNAHG